jgi:GTP-binding protein
VVFTVKENLRTLTHLKHKQVFKAKNGGDGMGSKMHGRDGEDVLIPVPPGTIIFDDDTGEKLFDFGSNDVDYGARDWQYLPGGKGGKGNVHYKSSTNQAPRYAEPGSPGIIKHLKVELNIMADVGLVGFPNAGKSSLLDYFTNARPKIAPYPFTTKIPNLGVLAADPRDFAERDIIIADIPGIIEGASEGAGLGIRFLKHIARTSALLFVIDSAEESSENAYALLCAELEKFVSTADFLNKNSLLSKPRMVLCNKVDVDGAGERAEKIRAAILPANPDTPVLAASVLTGEGMKAVKSEIRRLVFRRE